MIRIIVESDKGRVEFTAETVMDRWMCNGEAVRGRANGPLDDLLNIAQERGLEL